MSFYNWVKLDIYMYSCAIQSEYALARLFFPHLNSIKQICGADLINTEYSIMF